MRMQALMNDIEAYVKTDIGLRRDTNEDSYLIIDDTNKNFDIRRFGKMFVVADGLGGHAAGEVASKMACEGMLTYYMQQPAETGILTSPDKILMNIETVIHKTNREIYDHGQRNKKYHGMGTTLSVLVLWGNNTLIGHVGDSRIYRQRNNSLEQLTVDQTEVQSLVEKGYITPKQAASHPYRNILLQAVGVTENLDKVVTRLEEIKAGDIYLLSSDGLHDLVSDAEIQQTLTDYTKSQSACENLVKQALMYGGKDNITVVVVKVLEGD